MAQTKRKPKRIFFFVKFMIENSYGKPKGKTFETNRKTQTEIRKDEFF